MSILPPARYTQHLPHMRRQLQACLPVSGLLGRIEFMQRSGFTGLEFIKRFPLRLIAHEAGEGFTVIVLCNGSSFAREKIYHAAKTCAQALGAGFRFRYPAALLPYFKFLALNTVARYRFCPFCGQGFERLILRITALPDMRAQAR